MRKSEWSKKLKSNLLNNWRIRGIRVRDDRESFDVPIGTLEHVLGR